MNGYIYEITNTAIGKKYFGQTIQQNANDRWSRHRSALKNGMHTNCHLQSAWKKHGAAAFTFTVVYTITHNDPDEVLAQLNNLETLYVACNPEGYNLTAGGHNWASAETRRKLSDAGKGRRHSDETRRKMSKTRAGRPSPRKGKKYSDWTHRTRSEHNGNRRIV